MDLYPGGSQAKGTLISSVRVVCWNKMIHFPPFGSTRDERGLNEVGDVCEPHPSPLCVLTRSEASINRRVRSQDATSSPCFLSDAVHTRSLQCSCPHAFGQRPFGLIRINTGVRLLFSPVEENNNEQLPHVGTRGA